jgi:hypothetical protein
MNERIKELLKQATQYADSLGPIDGGEWCDAEYSKFAELIIEECMRMCDVAAVGYESHGDIKEANGAVLARKYIAEQFVGNYYETK